MSNLAPSSWREIKLSEILTESRIPIEDDKPSRRISVKLHLQGVHKRDERATDTIGSTTHFKRLKGQFIYGKQNFHNGAFGIIPNHLNGYGSSQDIPAFDVAAGYSINWLFQYFSRYEYYKSLERIASGTGSKRIQPKALFEESVLVPPLSEQQKIATILSAVDDVIEKTRAQIDKLKDLKTGMMQELLTKGIGHTEFKDSPVGRIPMGWSVVSLGQVTDSSAFGPRFSSDYYSESGNIGCIRTTDMDADWCIDYQTVPLANLSIDEFESHFLFDGDLLITRSGTCGVVDIFQAQSVPMVAAAFLIRFRLLDSVNPWFAKYVMMSSEVQSRIQLLASGGVQKNLSGTSLKTLQFAMPLRPEQDEIVKVINSINEKYTGVRKKLASYETVKKALMQDLLTGKVRVKLTDKESAVV